MAIHRCNFRQKNESSREGLAGHRVHGQRKHAGLRVAAKPAEQARHLATQATPSVLSLGLFCSLKPLLCVPPAVVAHLFTPHERERLAPSPVFIHQVPEGGSTQLFGPLHIKALSQTVTAVDRLPTPEHSTETPRQTLPTAKFSRMIRTL